MKFNHKNNTFVPSRIPAHKQVLYYFVFFSLFVPTLLYAQQSNKFTDDSEFLEQYINSMKYTQIISFDSSNIKQYWPDRSIISENGLIKINLAMNSSPLKIQLSNVNETLDCKIDVIAESHGFSFDVLNSQKKVLSKSTQENDFLRYSICSSQFHLEDTNDFSFYLLFSDKTPDFLSIKKILLSFSKNKKSVYLTSPGKICFNADNIQLSTGFSVERINDNSFCLASTANEPAIFSKNYFYTSNNTFSMSLKVKNIGRTSVKVYVGYAPYSIEKKQIHQRNAPYKLNHQILKVVSAEKDSDTIVVDSYPEYWTKGCYLVLNAKEDLSDYPNFDFVPSAILKAKKVSDTRSEIILTTPLKESIKPGTSLRVHSPYGAKYIYTNSITLQPGRDAELTSIIKKDNDFYGYSSKAFSKETYCVRPVVLSIPSDPKTEQKIQISDFSLSF